MSKLKTGEIIVNGKKLKMNESYDFGGGWSIKRTGYPIIVDGKPKKITLERIGFILTMIFRN